MMTEIDVEKLRANPKYYLFGYQQLDLASMHASFLKSIHEGYCFSTPQSVTFFSYAEDHFVRADDCFLDLNNLGIQIPPDYANHFGLVDWLFSRSLGIPSPNSLLPFEGLALVAYLAEWCVTSISTSNEHFRQTFYHGKAVTPCERKSISEVDKSTRFIQIQFTVAPPQFESRLLRAEKINEAFHELKKYALIPVNLQLSLTEPKAECYLVR